MSQNISARPLVRLVNAEEGKEITISVGDMEQTIRKGGSSFSILQAPVALMKMYVGELPAEKLLEHATTTDVEINGVRRSLLEVLREKKIID